MSDSLVNPRSPESSAGRLAGSARLASGPALDKHALAFLESKVIQRIEEKLDEARGQLLKSLEAHIDARLNRALSGSTAGGKSLAGAKDMLLQVMQSALFESGVLEKFVERSTTQKLEAIIGGNSAAGAPLQKVIKEATGKLAQEFLAENLARICQREVQATLSSENMKILIDDKFRAISLYLKTEVIPKTVAQILKGAKQPA